ncbi:hypothetical protein GE115_11610 [Agromyces sp. CFH 90414]|uniref:VWFA domain-containing protein n=1 Tax=Agromyces agglutinans TaxID=2662258 RepID=A0A6I2FDD3_9MICO|nr:VWA domain-containing protein [Agromyces agglutinans]MRG60506.1 hypothetical protein [Agromyces agglutinans]
MRSRTNSEQALPTRRSRREREHRRRRGVAATIASATIAAMLALGLPTVALAGETIEDPAATSAESTESEATTEVTPTEETPTEEAPAEETPAEEAPAEETPAEETPAEEAPTGEAPAEEVPADEPPVEAPQLRKAPAADPGEGGIGTMSVPNPGAGEAVITVRTGDVRSIADPNSISPLAGVQLGLFTTRTGGTQLFTCTADADGDCNFVIPNTGEGGVNRDREMWVRQIAAPGGYFTNPTLRTGDAFGGDNQSTSYSFRVGLQSGGTWQVRSGQTYTTTPPAEFMVSTGNENRDASGGVWQTSRNNPALPQQCGLDVALIMDLSGSVNPSIVQARQAGVTLVNSLVGTPSRVGLFTFAQAAPANNSNNQNRPISSVSTQPNANVVNGWINGLTAPTNGTTNWDRGLWQVANSATPYDVAIILTDGNPTVYGTESAPGSFTRMREVENAIFSANAIKSEATRVIALGVGSGVSAPSTALNLRAISGGIAFNGSNAAAADYYQTANYAAAGEALKQIALGNCQGGVSVTKQVVPPGGTIAQAVPAGGWGITATEPSAGVTVGTPNPADGLTAPVTGSISYPLDFAGGTSSGTVVIREAQQPGHTIIQQGGLNAVCRDLNTNTPIAGVTNNTSVPGQPGVNVPVSPTTAVSCTFTNQAPNPAATVVVDKFWVVNGAPPIAHGVNPALTGNASVNGSIVGFGSLNEGFTAGQTIPITEALGTLPTTCTLVSQQVTEVNGTPASHNLTGGPYQLLLASDANTVEITNTVNCPTKLTLRKDVDGDGVATNLWTLDAVNGPTDFPAGSDSGTGVTGEVAPDAVYGLAETGGDPRYVQVDNRNPDLSVPGSTGSWACVPLDANGNPTGGNAGGLNGGVIVGFGNWVQCTALNQTAQLTLTKVLQPLPGVTADPADWDLTATPQDPQIPGLEAETVTSGETFPVRPGKVYDISEAGGPAGWEQVSIECRTTQDGAWTTVSTVTVSANQSGECRVTNRPIPPKLQLTKVVTGDVAPPTAWTLSATRNDTAQVVASGAGGTAGFVEVPAGQALTLAETTALPNADQFGPGQWVCSLNDGPNIPGPAVAPLAAGDEMDCTVTNTLNPFVPSITKTAAIPVANADGTWTITYDVVVSNPSAFSPITYILSDQLDFGSETTVNSASYQRLTPLPEGPSTPWTVAFGQVQAFDGEPVLAPGTSHTWRVTVNATVDDGADFDGSTQAACDELDPGTVGFLNTATMYVGPSGYQASDCVLPVNPTIAKVGGTAVDNGDGTWTLPYTVTVTNPSATTGIVYDLVDTLDLPADVTATGPASVVSAPVPTVPTWTGTAPNTLLADDVALAGTAGVDQHVYQIQVVVELDADDGPFTCPSENGLNNVVTLVSGNQETDATGCVTIDTPDITHDKSVVPGSVMQAPDGTWSITYAIDVDNLDTIGGTYSLSDELHFGAGIDLSGATYSVTLNGGAAPLAWSGSGDLVVDRYLAGGASDLWNIFVSGIVVEGPELTPAQTACPQDASDGAFNNAGTLTVGGDDTVDTACDSPSAPSIVKSGATATQQPDATWDVSYTLTVSNTVPRSKPSVYTLVDEPGFPASVTLNSYTVEEVSPVAGPIATDVSPVPASIPVVAGESIATGATHVYRVTINATVPAGLPAGERECEPGTPGTGFFNTAVLTSGEIVDESEDCTPIEEGGRPTIVKDDPTVTQDADGLWTLEYDLTVTGNADFISTYTLTDTLRFGPSIDIESASWSGEGDDGTWADPEANPTTTIVGPAPKVIGIDEVHEYTVTVTANVDEGAFSNPTTLTCDPSEADPNVGFLNTATLTSDGVPQSDDGCGLPARPEIVKSPTGTVTQVGDEWEATYEITVENLSDTQELIYDLIDAPDFAGDVTITDREVESADVTVNPDWNGAESTDNVVVEDQALPGGATHTFTVTVTFTVAPADDSPELRCEGEGGKGLLNSATVVSGGSWTDDACHEVPVVVELLKVWVIDGGAPLAWDSPALPPGFSAQATLDGANVDWGVDNGPFELGDEVAVGETGVTVPAGCEMVNGVGNGTGVKTLVATHNSFTITNEVDCTQTVNLEKIVDNQYGGDAVPADWTVSATAGDVGIITGAGTASGPVEVGVGYTLNEVSTIWEDGVEYEVSQTWTCTSEQGDGAFTLVSGPGATSATLTVTQLGATVDCEITNTDLAPTLTLIKVVEPEAVAEEFPPTLWTLEAADGDTVVLTGDGEASGTVDSNTPYDLSESADFEGSDEFAAGEWVCLVTSETPAVPATFVDGAVTLEPGQEVECEIVNTARPATYEFEKTLTSVEQLPGGDWRIVYDVTVENTSAVSPVTYTLEDSLALFGEPISIESAEWTAPAGVEPASGSWTGLPDDRVETLATNEVLGAGDSHSYTVTVIAQPQVEAPVHEETECTPPGEFEPGGFRNLAILTVGGLPLERSVCAEPDFPTAVKTVSGGPTLNDDDTYTVEYEITVTGAEDHATYYDLSDTPALPAGVTFTATAADPAGDPVEGWTGTGDGTVLATDRLIAAGATETWTITLIADVSELTTIDDARCVEETSGKGFYNAGEFSTGVIVTPLEGCVDIPPVDVGIVKTFEDLPEGESAIEAGDEFTWVLTVTNHGDAVDGLVVTDLIDPQLEVTGPATFDPAAEPDGTWTQVSGDTDSAFEAEYTGTYPEGAVTTIRIPVRMLVPPPVETPPAVDPNAPPPVLPPLDTEPIPNEACVEITGGLPGEGGPFPVVDLDPSNDCDDAEVPVKRIQSAAYVRCIADVPWLYFDVQATENVEPGDITVTWTSADPDGAGPLEPLTRIDTIPWEEREGRLLWPGAAVDENGIPFEFPGWRPVTEADLADPGSVVPGLRFLDLILDETSPTFPWRGETYTPSGDPENPWIVTKVPLSVEFSVNPSQTVLAAYPQALPTCGIDRPPLLEIEKTSSVTNAKPGSSFEYTLQVTSTGIGAADPVTLFDEIPADLRVDSITTAPAPAFPRWENCQVTGKDASGYGGSLRCDLLGVLGPNITAAPPVTLDVTLRPTAKATSITNTGEVCYGNADDEADGIVCGESSVRITVPQPTAVTGFAGGPWVWAGASLLLLGGIAVVLAISRRRRGDVTG